MSRGTESALLAQTAKFHWQVNVLQAATINHIVLIVLVNYLRNVVPRAVNLLPVRADKINIWCGKLTVGYWGTS